MTLPQKVKFYQCSQCREGLYLFSNTTNSYDSSQTFTACVPDCSALSPQYVNDPFTGKCQDCGTNCKSCTINNGCSDCGTGSGYTPTTATGTTYSTFQQCKACTNNKLCQTCDSQNSATQCDACFNEFLSGVCSSGASFTQDSTTWISQVTPSKTECKQGNSKNGGGTCQTCLSQNCYDCNTMGGCSDCKEKYYKDGSNACTSCNPTSFLYQDCTTCSASKCTAFSSGYIDSSDTYYDNCPLGYVGSKSYKSYGRITGTTCSACDPLCKSCIGTGANQCTSCNQNYYLSLSSTSVNYGTCTAKLSSGSPSQTIIYATTNQISPNSNVVNMDGTSSKPYDNLMDAIERAYELAAPYKSASITILMNKGSHYLIRSAKTFYIPSKIDKQSQNLDLTIRPLYCSDSVPGGFLCATSGNQEVTIYNKINSEFVIYISKALLFQDIVVDSLDSILTYSGTGVEDICQSQFSQCCQTIQTNGAIDITGTTQQLQMICGKVTKTGSLNENCMYSRGKSVFKFSQSKSTQLTSSSSPQSLTLNHFMYEFNSFIEMNTWGASVSITSTTFNVTSNCGSLIRNFYKYYPTSDFSYSDIQATDTQNMIDYEDNYKRNLPIQEEVQAYLDSDTTSNPLSCTTNADSSSQQCFTISITNSKFMNFNWYKTALTFPPMVSNSGLRYLGQVLNLKDFMGTITITGNTFSDNQIAYGNCGAAWYIEQAVDQDLLDGSYSYAAMGNRIYTQIRNLVSIIGTSHKIVIAENAFTNNTAVKGLIYIDSASRTQPVFLYKNTFSTNVAYFGAVGIFIRTRSSVSTPVTQSDVSSENDVQCGGYLIQENTFTQNYACPKYGESMIEFECADQTYTLTNNDTYPFTYLYGTDQTTLESYKSKVTQYQSVSFTTQTTLTYNALNFIIFTKQLKFYKNTYTKNYASGYKGIISIRGAHFFLLDSETFTNNADSFDDIMTAPGGQFQETSGSYSNGNSYNQLTGYMRAMIYMDTVFYPTITSLTINGGFKLAKQYDSGYAQVLMIMNSRGPFSMASCTFSNLLGLQDDSSVTYDDGVTNNAQYVSDQSLIGFSNTYIAQYDITSLTLTGITIKGASNSNLYSSQPYVMAPDTGAAAQIYANDYKDYYAAQKVTITSLTMNDVQCKSCSNFMFAFASHDLKVDMASLTNVNYPSSGVTTVTQSELSIRSGIFGFWHIPISSVLSLTPITGASSFNTIQGAILRIRLTPTTLKPTYLIDGNTFLDIYQQESFGGIIAFNDTSQNLANLVFSNNIVTGMYSMGSLQSLSGGVICGINLKSFLADTNIIRKANLTYGNGDILMTLNSIGSITVTLTNNKFSQSDSPLDETTIMSALSKANGINNIGGGSASSNTFASIYLVSSSGDIDLVSTKNIYKNSATKAYGGFICLSNLYSLGKTTFTESQSEYSYGVATAGGGAIACIMCQQLTISGSTLFHYNYATRAGAIAMLYSPLNGATFTALVDAIISITDTTFENNYSYDICAVILIAESTSPSGSQLFSRLRPQVTLKDVTVTKNIANYQQTGVQAVTGFGGFLTLMSESFTLTVDGGTYDNNQAYQGGCFYILSNDLVPSTTSSIQFQNNPQFTQTSSVAGQGSVLFLQSSEQVPIYIDSGLYSSAGKTTPGQLFYLQYTGSSSLRHQVYITGAPTFSGVSSTSSTLSTYLGCVFYLINVDLTDSGGSTYTSLNCDKGGAFYLTSSSITVSSASFKSIKASYGGVVYADSQSDSIYVFNSDCNFDNITAVQGGLVNDNSACSTQTQTKEISSSTITNVRIVSVTNQQAAFLIAYIKAQNCNFLIQSTSISSCTLPSTIGIDASATMIRVEQALNFELNAITVSDIDQSSISIESFLFTSNPELQITVTDSQFTCNALFSDQIKETTMGSVFSISSAASFYSNGNTIKYCTFTTEGIYVFDGVLSITDYDSTYYYNKALTGGIYSITGSEPEGTSISISYCSYQYIYGSLGGILALYDYFTLNFFKNNVYYNSATKGGLVYITEVTTISNNSTATFTSNEISNNTASSEGGVAYISHSSVNVYFTSCSISKNYAPQGGVFSLGSLIVFSLDSNSIEANTAQDGTVLYSTSSSSYLDFQNNNFVGLSSYNYTLVSALLALQTQNYTSSFYISSTSSTINCYQNTYKNFYANQRGGVYYLDSVAFYEDSSTYKNNSALIGGAIYCTKCTVQTISNNYQYNIANEGGVIYIESDASYLSNHESFQTNKAILFGGAIFITTRSIFKIYNGKFQYNYAGSDSAISALKTSITTTFMISDCQFISNSAGSNLISAKMANGDIINSLFLNNKALSSTNNIFLSFSTLNVTSCKFQDTTFKNPATEVKSLSLQGSYIYVSLNVVLVASNCLFDYGLAQQGGAIYINGLSTVNITYSTFTNNYASSNGGAIYSSGYQFVGILNSNFNNNVAYGKGSEYYALFSNYFTYIENTTVSNPSPVSSFYCDTISFQAKTLTITANTAIAPQGGAITCINCEKVDIDSSIFKNLRSQTGGAIYLEQTDASKVSATSPTYYLTNSVLSNNRAYNGGGLLLSNVEYMNISNTIFNNNTAYNVTDDETSGLGGGVYFTCLKTYKCNVLIRGNSIFTNNKAEKSGAGIKWDQVEPAFGSNSFSNNKATLYGNDIGSFPQKIISITEAQYESQMQSIQNISSSSSSLRRVLDTVNSTTQSISDQQSGGTIPQMFLALADKYNNIVGNTNTAKITLRIDVTYNNNNSKSLMYAPILEGISQFQAIGGVFNISGISFASSPGYSYKVLFVTDGIDSTLPSNAQYLQSINTSSSTIDYPLYIALRECEVGESFSDSGKCLECPSNTSYLLDKLTSPGSCKTCPSATAKCLGGSNIGPQPGYWRKSNTTNTFIKCPNTAACLGIQAPDYNPQGTCAANYMGTLCANCEANYSRNSDYQCAACPDPGKNVTRLLFILLGVIVAVCFLIRSTLKGAKEKKNVTSIYSKILMNHIQLILLTASFNFKWPDFVLAFFSITSPVAQVGDQILSVDCFLNTQSSSSSGLDTNTEYQFFRIFYVKLLMMALLPILLFMMCYAVWSVIAYIKKTKEVLRSRAISSLVILLFLVHPNIVQYMFSAFNCYTVDDDQRVYADLQIICYKGAHFFWSLGVALPCLIVWGLGIPFFAFILMSRVRTRLTKMDVKELYGFLYNGYKKEFFYWEVVIMYRKILMIVIAVIIKSYGVITQALVVFLILIFFLILNMKKKPFIQIALNDLETASLVTSMITIYCGIFFITDMSDVITSTDSTSLNTGLYLNDDLKIFFFVCIVAVNAFFFVYWAYKMYIEIRAMMVKKMQKIYLVLCLCMNKQKLDRDVYANKISEENELLREDYMKTLKKLKILYTSGELILNQLALEKLQIYLSKERVLKAVGQTKQQFDTDELNKLKKRNERISKFKKNKINIEIGKAPVEELYDFKIDETGRHVKRMGTIKLSVGQMENSNYGSSGSQDDTKQHKDQIKSNQLLSETSEIKKNLKRLKTEYNAQSHNQRLKEQMRRSLPEYQNDEKLQTLSDFIEENKLDEFENQFNIIEETNFNLDNHLDQFNRERMRHSTDVNLYGTPGQKLLKNPKEQNYFLGDILDKIKSLNDKQDLRRRESKEAKITPLDISDRIDAIIVKKGRGKDKKKKEQKRQIFDKAKPYVKKRFHQRECISENNSDNDENLVINLDESDATAGEGINSRPSSHNNSQALFFGENIVHREGNRFENMNIQDQLDIDMMMDGTEQIEDNLNLQTNNNVVEHSIQEDSNYNSQTNENLLGTTSLLKQRGQYSSTQSANSKEKRTDSESPMLQPRKKKELKLYSKFVPKH